MSGCFYLTFLEASHCSMLALLFLQLNNSPLYRQIIFCLSFHQLVGIWVGSTFWLLEIELL